MIKKISALLLSFVLMSNMVVFAQQQTAREPDTEGFTESFASDPRGDKSFGTVYLSPEAGEEDVVYTNPETESEEEYTDGKYSFSEGDEKDTEANETAAENTVSSVPTAFTAVFDEEPSGTERNETADEEQAGYDIIAAIPENETELVFSEESGQDIEKPDPEEQNAEEQSTGEQSIEEHSGEEQSTEELNTETIGSEEQSKEDPGNAIPEETDLNAAEDLYDIDSAAPAQEDYLIRVGGKTVTAAMKLDDVIALFGQPKLKTYSFFGGNACTFYGNNYSDYLYLETFADQTIACYGSVSEGFETPEYSYGDNTIDFPLGYIYNDYNNNNRILGIVLYTKRTGTMSDWMQEAYLNNQYMSRHSVEMANAFLAYEGSDKKVIYDENILSVNQQLAENNSDLDEYCKNTGNENYYFSMGGYRLKSSAAMYRYMNPLNWSERFRTYRSSLTDVNAIASMIRRVPESDYGDLWFDNGFINPAVFDEKESVEYTEEEKKLLAEARRYYSDCIQIINDSIENDEPKGSGYVIEPQFEKLPLTAGTVKMGVERGLAAYLNAIRAGAGLPLLRASETLAVSAQHKATLTMYMSVNKIPNPNPHYPDRPEGVDDAFYRIAMNDVSENLFFGDLISGIQHALSDAAGAGQYYNRGHRYNLLNPYWTEVGIGSTNGQSCHHLAGSQAFGGDVVAWPSKGVMIRESGFRSQDMMTCSFLNGYTCTDDTIVTIKCLNDGRTWVISKDTAAGQEFCSDVNLISFSDESFAMAVGNVYTFTYTNLRDGSGRNVSYSYRCVYERADTDGYSEPEALSMSELQLNLVPGEQKKLYASITPAYSDNALITWKSSDPSVVTVNGNGLVTAVRDGEAVITAATANGIAASCTVSVSSRISVSSLSARTVSMGVVEISWNKAEKATGYLVLRGGKQVGYSTGANTHYVDLSADPDDFNYYWVIPFIKRADGTMLKGELSNYVWALGRTVDTVEKVTTNATANGIELSWPAASGANAYVILSKTGSAKAAFNPKVAVTGTSYTDKAKAGVQFYWVYAVYNNKDGKTLAAGKVSPYAWAVAK